MPSYDNSKLYLITPKNGQGNGFIGATTKPYLCSKFQSDIVCYNNYKSGKTKAPSALFNFFDEHGVANCRIVLIMNYPCKSIDELSSKLYEVINQTTNCINNDPAYLPVSLGLPLDNGVETTSEEKKVYLEDNTHFVCSCGGRYTLANKKQHTKTKIHINFITIEDVKIPFDQTENQEEEETIISFDQTENQNGPY